MFGGLRSQVILFVTVFLVFVTVFRSHATIFADAFLDSFFPPEKLSVNVS